MKWSKTVRCPRPIRAVRLASGRGDTGAEAEAAQARREEEAFQRGLVEGERRLSQQLMQQRTEIQHLHTGVLQALKEAVTSVVHQTEGALVDLAFEVASKVVAEIPISRELVEASVRSALVAARDAAELAVHLHPEDLELLQRHGSDVLTPPSGSPQIRFIPAPDVARGGCLVRTEFGAIDARRETRLERMRQALDA